MKVLGIDPGIKNCGWGVIDMDGPPVYVAAGVIQPEDDGAGHGERLLSVGRQVARLIGEYEPTAVAIERPIKTNRFDRPETGWLLGHLLAIVAKERLTPYLYDPATLKKRIAGHGKANKEDIACHLAIKGLWWPGMKDHAADALAVALVLAEDLDVDQAG